MQQQKKIPSLKLTQPLKIGLPKVVFQPSIFRCYVHFLQGNHKGVTKKAKVLNLFAIEVDPNLRTLALYWRAYLWGMLGRPSTLDPFYVGGGEPSCRLARVEGKAALTGR